MGKIMNSPKGVKLGVLERVSISCPTCDTRHDLSNTTGNQSYVTVREQRCQIFEQGMYDDHRISEK